MGEVYRARDLSLKREVAIKILPAFVSQDPDRLRRFEQEAQAAAALNHPNILAVHQFGSFQGAPYLVSELLLGGTLREALDHGPLPVRKTIDYGVQIAHGLAAAHDKGIVHRDLKPENLFVTKEGRVKILDFGLAKLKQQPDSGEGLDGIAPTQTKHTEPGVVMGTAGYMSPEQVRGKTVDHRTDIFAFGAILYEVLTGKRAFHRSTSAETMTAILNEDPRSISQVTQSTPPGLQRVVHRCLEKNPEQRFQSASDLAFALEALSDSGSVPGAAIPPRPRPRRLWIAATGFAAALIAALIVWWRTPPADPVVESVTQITDDGEPKDGGMASDGSRIYFDEGPTGITKIAQVSVAGGHAAPLETRLVNPSVINVKRDGSELLVRAGFDLDLNAEPLWSIPLPAGEPRRLGAFETKSADIFPDGRIVFAQFTMGKDPAGTDGTADWLIADKDGTNPRKLISFPGYDIGEVLVEPNGHRILLTQRDNNINRRLLDMAADGTGLREIRKLSGNECCFSWTPDEKYLVYQSGDEDRSDIWTLPMKTGLFRRPGKPVRLTNGPLTYSNATPSRDGKQIFVLGTKARGELVRFDIKSQQFVPFLSGISAKEPRFSRDGKWVTYVSYPDKTLWRSRIDGSERLQLTYPPMKVFWPYLSPDGTKVAFSSNDALYLIDMSGGQPQRITDGVAALWSPDGNLLVFNWRGLKTVDLRTKQISPVPGGQQVGAWWVDQDTLVAATFDAKKFQTFSFKTQKWSDLAAGNFVNWGLSLDSKYLYFTTAGTESELRRIRLADGQQETITSLKNLRRIVDNRGETDLAVGPDDSLIFTRDIGTQEIYALNIRWP